MRTFFHAQLSTIDDEAVDMTLQVGSSMNQATQSRLGADLALTESVIAADSGSRRRAGHTE